jgi:hypothetical protein
VETSEIDQRRSILATWDRHVLDEHKRRVPLHECAIPEQDGLDLAPISFTLDRTWSDRLEGALSALDRQLPEPLRSRFAPLRSTAVEIAINSHLAALAWIPAPQSAPGADLLQLAPGFHARMDRDLSSRFVTLDVRVAPSLVELLDYTLRHLLDVGLPEAEAASWLSKPGDHLRSALIEQAVVQWLTLRELFVAQTSTATPTATSALRRIIASARRVVTQRA